MIDVNQDSLPTLILADGSRAKPLGMCKLRLWITKDHSFFVLAYVVPNQDIDFILGSSEFKQRKGCINYEDTTVSIDDKGTTYTVPFVDSEVPCEAASVLYAKTETLVPPHREITLRVHTPSDQNRSINSYNHRGQWGFTGNADSNRGFFVQTTTLERKPGNEKVRVYNYTSNPVRIRRGSRVALFTPGDRSAYRRFDFDPESFDSTSCESADEPFEIMQSKVVNDVPQRHTTSWASASRRSEENLTSLPQLTALEVRRGESPFQDKS